MKRRALLTPEQAAEHLGISLEDLQRHHANGTGPHYLEPSARTIRYLVDDLDAWNPQAPPTHQGEER